ncbi:MAG: hypothetical protein PHD01_05750 [Geobacteraceae bacterium]|nr:hypothetical protein [Geobacteraceae bacterium]
MSALPKFIVVSGIDGSGKTTIINCLKQRLEENGVKPHYIWLRYNHLIIKPVHALCRLVGLSRRHDSSRGQVWRHEFYRSQLFCSLYIYLTWFDTWFGRLKLAWQLRNIDASVVICDRWVNDILIDLAVDSRRADFLESSWTERFHRIVPVGTKNFLIVRDNNAVLNCRPECQDDPDFEFRKNMYGQLQEIPSNIIVLFNDGSVEQTVDNLITHLNVIDRPLA